MDEVRFVIKCFLFSALLLVLTQLKTGGITIENQIQSSLVNSEVADFVNKTANGGVKIIKDGAQMMYESYINWKKKDDDVISESLKKVQKTDIRDIEIEETESDIIE